MVWTSLLLGLLAGVILGAVAVVLWSRGKGAEAVKLVQDAREADRQDLGRQLAERDQRMQELQRELLAINGSFATERQRNEGLEEKLGTQKAELESLNERMTKEFKHIANTLMEEKGKQLTDRQEGTLKLLLDPFKERIKEFQEQVRPVWPVKRAKSSFRLRTHWPVNSGVSRWIWSSSRRAWNHAMMRRSWRGCSGSRAVPMVGLSNGIPSWTR